MEIPDEQRQEEELTMQAQTKDFLIAEYESSWQQVLNIDTRRGMFFNYFNVVFLAVLTVVANLWDGGEASAASLAAVEGAAPSLPSAVAITIILLFTILIGNTLVKILKSERAANVRYRNKINLIRETFLSNPTDPKIEFYMKQKDLGIKDFTYDKESINATGRTLKRIFKLIRIEQVVLFGLTVLVWAIYFKII